ncbi:MAG: hypothetical protein A3G34_10625 [Candidatus Lindowbacteria bacterium RIFCSPLOWO2_12_FULL_62_27]|nr:MAG: hypothetical protein A3G34_10625 [Candidatus Lindowbacteria bacterium RIFCSPLOWO2_12_FULL_62_27]
MELNGRHLFKAQIIIEDIANFTRNLGTFLKSGDSLPRALSLLEQRMQTQRMKRLLKKLQHDVNRGSSLSEAISKHRVYFSPMYIQTVKAGEMNGVLGTALSHLAHKIGKEYLRTATLRGIMTYPVVMAAISILVIAFLLFKIIPTFGKMFEDMGVKLPLPTRIVLEMSKILVEYWWGFLIFIALYSFAIYVFMTRPCRIRPVMDRMILKLPIIGDILLKNLVSRSLNILGILLKSGVDVIAAVRTLQDVIDNSVIAAELDLVLTHLEQGNNLSDSMKHATVFPLNIIVLAVKEAERDDDLGQKLMESSSSYERIVDETVLAVSHLIEPLMVVCLGGAIGIVVMAMFFPMFEMINLVKDDKQIPAQIKKVSVQRQKMDISDTVSEASSDTKRREPNDVK